MKFTVRNTKEMTREQRLELVSHLAELYGGKSSEMLSFFLAYMTLVRETPFERIKARPNSITLVFSDGQTMKLYLQPPSDVKENEYPFVVQSHYEANSSGRAKNAMQVMADRANAMDNVVNAELRGKKVIPSKVWVKSTQHFDGKKSVEHTYRFGVVI